MSKKVVTARLEGARTRGRPRKRWADEAEEDLTVMCSRNWHTVARDRNEWKRTVLEAKVKARSVNVHICQRPE
jgi:hypothetical protein